MISARNIPASWRENVVLQRLSIAFLIAFGFVFVWVVITVWQRESRISANPETAGGHITDCVVGRNRVVAYEFAHRGERFTGRDYYGAARSGRRCAPGEAVRVEFNALDPNDSRLTPSTSRGGRPGAR